MQVEGVGSTRGVGGGDWEGEFNNLVRREFDDAASREERGGILRAAHDLEEDGDSGRDEGRAIDGEEGAVLCHASASATH